MKTLTAEMVGHIIGDDRRFTPTHIRNGGTEIAKLLTEDERNALFRILHGAHEVHDRATHRAVSVESATVALHVLRHMQGYYEHDGCRCSDPAYVTAALAEIEEKLGDA